ncbi:MAG: helix-turn-helix domain-containing protein [Sterolibacterium sp.]|jgi:AraC family ethanolamine operon transcriptional activator
MTTADTLPVSAIRRDSWMLDPHELAGRLSGWDQHYEQISRGAFHGRLVEIEFADIHVFEETLEQAVFQTGRCRHDIAALGVFSTLSGDARWHGRSVGLDDVLFLDGSGELLLSTPQNSTLYAVDMPVAALEPWCEHAPLAIRESLRRLVATSLRDPMAAQRLRQGIGAAIGELLLRPEEALPRSVTLRLRDELVMLVADLLQGEPDSRERTASSKAKEVVRRTRAYALERRDAPPTLLDLCRHTHVSPRTLQYCFQSVLGESPASYMKMLRLNGARKDLKRFDRGICVGDIAADWGFWHLSQFASDYRRMFGELPSATLAKR